MSVGQVWKPEVSISTDPVTGVEITRLTHYKGNHNHLYFTNPGWYDNNSKLVIVGDREDRSNLYSVDLNTYELTQLTDLEELPPPYEHVLQVTAVDPVRNMAYFACGRDILSLNLMTYERKTIWTFPEKYLKHVVSCGADSNYVYISIYQDLSDQFTIDIERGYIGFDKIFEAHPESRIVKIRVDGSGAETVRTEHCWIGHVNVSPINDDLISFCHEGPWNRVDNRIWGMNTVTGEVWKIRPCTEPGETVGHEYWHKDGIHLGYHGARVDGNKFFGTIRYDNTERVEVAFNHLTGHIHSQDQKLIVGDGNRESEYIRLWKWDSTGYQGPKALCQHFSSFKTQRDHVHPCFTPDGGSVLFSSDRSGYTSVYLAKLRPFEELPDANEVIGRK